MAMACFFLLTDFPDLPLFSWPVLRSCMAFATSFWAILPYLAIGCAFRDGNHGPIGAKAAPRAECHGGHCVNQRNATEGIPYRPEMGCAASSSARSEMGPTRTALVMPRRSTRMPALLSLPTTM